MSTPAASVALLREAARQMRERAERATPGPWFFADEQDEDGSYYVGDTILAPSPRADVERGADEVMELGSLWPPANTRLAASWPPAVVVAAAELLEAEADHCELVGEGWFPHGRALTLARVYLSGAVQATSTTFPQVSAPLSAMPVLGESNRVEEG